MHRGASRLAKGGERVLIIFDKESAGDTRKGHFLHHVYLSPFPNYVTFYILISHIKKNTVRLNMRGWPAKGLYKKKKSVLDQFYWQ